MNPVKAQTGFDWVLLGQRLLAIGVILAIWQAVYWLGVVPSMTPAVNDVATAVASSLLSSMFWAALGQTMYATLVGWLLAVVGGVVIGLLIGSLSRVDRASSILVDFGRCFPVLALMPVVVLLLGTTGQMKVVLVTLSCFWHVLVQAIAGARRLEASVVDTTRVFGIGGALWFRRVLLPSALPFISTGIRISASIAILISIGVEVLTQAPGLGRLITLAQDGQRWDFAFAYIFFSGVIGWTIAMGLAFAEKRALRWARQSDD